MKRTSPAVLVALAGIGLIAAFLLQLVLAAWSMPKLQPAPTVAISLVVIAALVVALAVPIRRSSRGGLRPGSGAGAGSGADARAAGPRGPRAARVDPFYATRVVMLAKASSLVGALFTGSGLGLLLEALVRTVAPGADGFARIAAVAVGGVVLLVGGLVAEHFCTVPPDDPGPDTPTPA